MLRSLDIRDMLIIDRLNLEFQPGLNVLTGETGAGKSILLDSLGFVLGWRGRAELVRQGAATGEVIAEFELPADHAAWSVLEEAGFEPDGELILRRVNQRDGRKQAFVNDRRVSGEVLRALSDVLIELHGQHDDRGLLNPRGHRALLDAYAGLDLAKLHGAWRKMNAARRALEAANEALLRLRAEEDFLRHSVAELDALAPRAGEEAELDRMRRLMQAGEKIREDISKASQALGLQGAEGLISDAQRWLEGTSTQAEGRLDNAIAALERVFTELGVAQDEIEQALVTMEFDPGELETTEERLFAIRALARKHDVQPDELEAFASDLTDRLRALDSGGAEISALEADFAKAQEAYDTEAEKVSQQRAKAAAKLDKAMAAELGPLKMDRAVFSTAIDPAEASQDGKDAVAFMVSTNPGTPAGALNKIASGGELSRFLLALKACLASNVDGVTMIFDEIDRGVGGATADAVGRRLAALAEGSQVLVVTHSPQVAALGGHHWRVEKRVAKDETLSTVTPLDPEARVEEIARMVAGDTVTDAAKDAARALLAG